MLLDITGDKQERGQKGKKAQENTRKKGMKAVNSELIQHFVPHFQQSNGL